MPYLCQVRISGPPPDPEGVTQMMNAVAEAIEAGWDAPRIMTGEEEPDIPDEALDDSPDGRILDYRVFGYPGGAVIVVVLDGGDLAQTAVAVTGLAKHLTTWSPGMLEYSPSEVSISRVDEPYDDENWLPPLTERDDENPRWPLAELLDDELQFLSAEYLLVTAVRSLWNPAEPGRRAWDVVAGSVEHPWGSELTNALGVLLIRAARLEAESGTSARLVVRGSGSPELAAELLRRARESARAAETEGWTDDEMRGYKLVEHFMTDHDLGWDRIGDSEATADTDDRSTSQLRALLWAGLRAVATLASSLTDLSGPWQVLAALGGPETLVAALASEEAERTVAAAEEDLEEIEGAAVAHVLVWLAIRKPELLPTSAADSLLRHVALDGGGFQQVCYQALLLAGAGPVKAALAQQRAPARMRASMKRFAAALAATEEGESAPEDDAETTGSADPYDDMGSALEQALAEGPSLAERARYLLAVIGHAAELTETDSNPYRTTAGYISAPRELAAELLAHPAEHAALVLHRDDDETAVRNRALSLAARLSPAVAGEMAADFPDLTGDDPRLEPASRTRALHWVSTALKIAREQGREVPADPGCGPDAAALTAAVTAGQDPPSWPVQRLITAGAEAAAAILHAVGALDHADEVFAA
jgi:hypothetical protein